MKIKEVTLKEVPVYKDPDGNPDPTKWNPVKLQAWVVEV